jgi:PAS domain S-box-containing protein
MSARQHSAQYLVALFIVVALAVQTLPLWLVSLNRIENVPQFQRTVVTLALSSALTIGLGTWLFMRVSRRLNQQLAASERSYRELFASIQSPVVAYGEDLTITFCNAAWASLVGGQIAALIGSRIADTMPGWADSKLRIASQAVLATGWAQQYSKTYAGREFDVWVWRTPSGILVFSDDITERHELLIEIRRLAAMVETSDDGIILVDLQGRVTDWNRGAERIYGYTKDEVVGQPVQKMIGLGRDEEFREITSHVLTGQGLRQLETQRVTKAGRTIWVSLTVSPILDENGKVTAISSVTRDISLRREMEAELEDSRRRQAELLGIQRTVATVAHEINNPLTAQLLLLDAIGDEVADNAEARELVDEAQAQGRRMAGFVDSLQQVASPEYKTYVGKTQMLDVEKSRRGPGSAIT